MANSRQAKQRKERLSQRGRSLPISGKLLALGGVSLLVALGLLLRGSVLQSDGRAGNRFIAELRTADIHALKFDAASEATLFFGHHNGLLRSTDGGYSWAPVVQRSDFDAMGLVIGSERIYMAGHDTFQVSGDGGVSWRPVLNNLPGSDIHGFAASPDIPDRLYGFVVGQGLFRSNDAGATWASLSKQLPADVMGVLAVGTTPEKLYAASMSGGLLLSMDGGASWTAANDGLASRRVIAIGGSPDGSRLYAGTDEGLYRGGGGTQLWERLPFPGKNVMALAVSPRNPQLVVAIEAAAAGTGRVYRSENGGISWVSR